MQVMHNSVIKRYEAGALNGQGEGPETVQVVLVVVERGSALERLHDVVQPQTRNFREVDDANRDDDVPKTG